ncbi:hypothetical protein [Streptomyces sp. SAJ15]|uniref:DUF7848 domain-containing protein n=1 Tax=Streptomyces sp. SAJ15 TaxID=2011095 RepID=UPI0028CB2FAB|nr:hypothetical protein [Streptomyces sp. SAJ15]
MSEQTPPAAGGQDRPSLEELGRRGDDLAERVRSHLGPRGGARRATYRFREYTIGLDRRPQAEPHSFTMQCADCGDHSAPHGSGEGGTEWAVAHLKAHPGHLAYREIITRPYRFEPGVWR